MASVSEHLSAAGLVFALNLSYNEHNVITGVNIMPKVIKDLEQRLLHEARSQIAEKGYSGTTIRSVAAACGVGVGTVYNYFSSKDELLASYLLSDWQQCISAVRAVSTYSESPVPVLRCIYDQLTAYAEQNRNVFGDNSAVPAFAAAFGRYHELLRSQIAEPLRKFCRCDFDADFIAESLL